MNSIKNVTIKNKKVILRCDFNVTIKDGKILDSTKIKKSLNTIKLLLENNNKLIILSHLGKIKSESDKLKNTLYPVYNELKSLLNYNVYFSEETRGVKLEALINNLKEKEVLLVENTRYEDYPEKLESGCDDNLSKYWASLGDVFVNDAFGTSHRRHASNYGITKYIETYYGLLIDEEITKLNELIFNPTRPFTVIMGGAKVDDKIILIEELLKNCDKLILGGGIANTFLLAKGYNIGNSLANRDYLEKINEIIKKHVDKIILPTDFYVSNNEKREYRKLDEIKNDDIIYDVGEESIKNYEEILNISNTIFINGTIGMYENESFKYGTEKILNILDNSKAKVFVGGGDAVTAANNLGYEKSFYYKSTGGGATLEYIINKKAIALEE